MLAESLTSHAFGAGAIPSESLPNKKALSSVLCACTLYLPRQIYSTPIATYKYSIFSQSTFKVSS